MGNNSVPKFIFRLSMFPVYRGSVLGRFYCIRNSLEEIAWEEGVDWIGLARDRDRWPSLVNTVVNLCVL